MSFVFCRQRGARRFCAGARKLYFFFIYFIGAGKFLLGQTSFNWGGLTSFFLWPHKKTCLPNKKLACTEINLFATKNLPVISALRSARFLYNRKRRCAQRRSASDGVPSSYCAGRIERDISIDLELGSTTIGLHAVKWSSEAAPKIGSSNPRADDSRLESAPKSGSFDSSTSG